MGEMHKTVFNFFCFFIFIFWFFLLILLWIYPLRILYICFFYVDVFVFVVLVFVVLNTPKVNMFVIFFGYCPFPFTLCRLFTYFTFRLFMPWFFACRFMCCFGNIDCVFGSVDR